MPDLSDDKISLSRIANATNRSLCDVLVLDRMRGARRLPSEPSHNQPTLHSTLPSRTGSTEILRMHDSHHPTSKQALYF